MARLRCKRYTHRGICLKLSVEINNGRAVREYIDLLALDIGSRLQHIRIRLQNIAGYGYNTNGDDPEKSRKS